MPNLRGPRASRSKPSVEVRNKVVFDDILEELNRHHRAVDENRLREVHDFSSKMHADQVRRSGKPYLTHPISVD